MIYDIDIADAYEQFYKDQVFKHFGVFVVILRSMGSFNIPQCCLIGQDKDLREWFADDLGYGEKIEDSDFEIEDFDLKKIDKKPQYLIKKLFT